MSLILLLIFCLFCFSLSDTFDYIENDKKKTITSNYGYVDLSEFSGYFQLLVITTVKNGTFSENRHLSVTGGSEKPVDPSKYIFDTNYIYKKESHEIINDEYKFQTLDFHVHINSDWEYIYFRFPERTGGSLEVTITTNDIPKVLVWILPLIFAIIIIVIIFFCVRRHKRKKAQVYNREQFQVTPPPAQPSPDYETTVSTSSYIPPPQPIYPPQTVY